MADQEAIDLIKGALKKGKDKKKLIGNLKKAGYSDKEAKNVYKKAAQQTGVMEKKEPKEKETKEEEDSMELEEVLSEDEEELIEGESKEEATSEKTEEKGAALELAEEKESTFEESKEKEEVPSKPKPSPEPSKEPEPERSTSEPSKKTTRKPSASAGGTDPITKTLNYFRDFWTQPVNAMKNAASEKKFVLPVIMVALAFILTWGQIAATTAKAEGSSIGASSKVGAQLFFGLGLNPANIIGGLPVSETGDQLLAAFVGSIIPFLAIVFTSTMVLRALGEAKQRITEALIDNFKLFSVPYSLIVVFSAIFSMITLGILPAEGQVTSILLVIVSFFPVFFSVYAYVLYAMVIKEKYDVNLKVAAGVSLVILLVMVLFVKVALMGSGMGMAAGNLMRSMPLG